ncbi:hypothetical protein [Devosia sp. 63-57]|uniref:hypothetical protein n=1 Tax=Devosia sp. 63-57 TaxID=1895751 RepID=UPI00086F9404|nr:hypothetical protein [Devosia sp. 63-57]ODT50506.1 MAG: hypothetical protein ABS74_03030 [Pelagibacterium sp. SCN 63-126]ODU88589.1 MAG: hypothetical protein ABT14_02630 [Pelagibacterium sp. SCN 63-17]OJX45543.1 MAG: hypothetical protein BGO80_07015 [Devosia sp. 63-57]
MSLFITLATICLVTLVVFGIVQLQSMLKPPTPGPAQKAFDHLDARFKATNDLLKSVIHAENSAVQSLLLLPDDVHPAEAFRVLDAAMPGSNVYDRSNLLEAAWIKHKRQPILAAMAGMALALPEQKHSILRTRLSQAMNHAAAPLLLQIAELLLERQDQLSDWLPPGGVLTYVERGSRKAAASAPEIAARLDEIAALFAPRTLELMLKTLRFEIASAGEMPDISPEQIANQLAPYCFPRFPQLLAEAHMELDRHPAPSRQIAHLALDAAVLEHFQGFGSLDYFDMGKSLSRLCDAIGSTDANVSRRAAEIAASQLADYFYDTPEFHLALQSALDWAVGQHGEAAEYDWLSSELNPPEITEAKLRQAQTNLEEAQKLRDGARRFGETTASLDPETALAELRLLLPDIPADMLSAALVEQWRASQSEVWLAGLAGLAIEQIDMGEGAEGPVDWYLHWPLTEGSPALIASVVQALDTRLERLDGYIRTLRGHRDLHVALRRLRLADRQVASILETFKDKVDQRRTLLLEAEIAARLDREAQAPDDRGTAQLVLDLYRFCVPGEPRLIEPVRTFLAARAERRFWHCAQLDVECMVLIYFGGMDALAGYDFSYLRQLYKAGLADADPEVVDRAAFDALRLLKKGIATTDSDLAAFSEGLAAAGPRAMWTDNLIELERTIAIALVANNS